MEQRRRDGQLDAAGRPERLGSNADPWGTLDNSGAWAAYQWDVSADVQSWLLDGEGNYGWQFVVYPEGGSETATYIYEIGGAQHPQIQYRPKLDVMYKAQVTPTPSYTPIATMTLQPTPSNTPTGTRTPTATPANSPTPTPTPGAGRVDCAHLYAADH